MAPPPTPIARISTDEASIKSLEERKAMLTELSLRHPTLNNIARFIDQNLLLAAGQMLRLDAAPGIDEVRTHDYIQALEQHSEQLIKEVTHKTYQPTPARRVMIPKDGGGKRKIAIPTCRDKHLQGAVRLLLEAIYEPIFYEHSYGFRPGRSTRMAHATLRNWIANHKGAWILEVDIQKFFDNLAHQHLLDLIEDKLADNTIRRLIIQWLTVGTIRRGKAVPAEKGPPQGGVISPILANIYLHTVLDTWLANDYIPALQGEAILVRYADDFVVAFESEGECRQARKDIQVRLEDFGLAVHKEKTNCFGFYPENSSRQGDTEISFLGFSLYWKNYPGLGWRLVTRVSERSKRRFFTSLDDWMDQLSPSDLRQEWSQGKFNRKVDGYQAYFNKVGGIDESPTRVALEAHLRWANLGTRSVSRHKARVTAATTANHEHAFPNEERGQELPIR